jgi:virulence-associated protein VagC
MNYYKEFRFRGDKVRVRRVTSGVLLEPVLDVREWFARMDEVGGGTLMESGRYQPTTPSRKVFDWRTCSTPMPASH